MTMTALALARCLMEAHVAGEDMQPRQPPRRPRLSLDWSALMQRLMRAKFRIGISAKEIERAFVAAKLVAFNEADIAKETAAGMLGVGRAPGSWSEKEVADLAAHVEKCFVYEEVAESLDHPVASDLTGEFASRQEVLKKGIKALADIGFDDSAGRVTYLYLVWGDGPTFHHIMTQTPDKFLGGRRVSPELLDRIYTALNDAYGIMDGQSAKK